jgi:predicted PurR-regulated permease PerM
VQIEDTVRSIAPSILQNTGLLGLEWLFLWFFILFLLFFMLLEGPVLVRRVVDVFGPSGELKAKAAEVLKETAHQIRTYIVWRTIVNFGLAIIVGLVFQWGGLRQPWTWAVLLAILNYIPYLGPFLAGVPPLLDAFVSTEFHWLLILSAVYWAIIIFEGYLIVPLVMGRSMDLNAVTVMLACLFWELVWGMTGLFLAMPIMAGVKSVCMHVPGWRPWANLMSAEEIDVKSEGVADAITDDASPADAMLNAPPASPNGEAERAAKARSLQD